MAFLLAPRGPTSLNIVSGRARTNMGGILLGAALLAMTLSPLSVRAQSRFSTASPNPAHALAGKALIDALRSGKLVIYFRHAAIEVTGTGQENCRGTTLSEQGRNEAKLIAEQFSRLKIPVGKVLSSPSCRTKDHARISFGDFEAVEFVFGEQNNFDKLADRLTAEHDFKGNLVIVGHISGMKSIAGSPLLEYSEAALIRPGKDAAIVARLKIGDWATLQD
ncbi:MAG: histidine phosphatase family protein [Betaproteobacteria bacterium]|nr:histidine phosphatase family protein [Betaproteobacteria bacterium]